MLSDFDRAHGLKSIALRYFYAACADLANEIGKDHTPETHLIPLVLDAVSGRRTTSLSSEPITKRPTAAAFGGDVGQRCRELLRETAGAHEIVIHAGSINRDHLHMLLSIRPSLSGARAVQYLKGRSSHKLLGEFASLRKRYWGQHVWARGYWVASSGNVTDEVMRYGRNTFRIRRRRNQTMTSRWSEAAEGGPIRLSAVI